MDTIRKTFSFNRLFITILYLGIMVAVFKIARNNNSLPFKIVSMAGAAAILLMLRKKSLFVLECSDCGNSCEIKVSRIPQSHLPIYVDAFNMSQFSLLESLPPTKKQLKKGTVILYTCPECSNTVRVLIKKRGLLFPETLLEREMTEPAEIKKRLESIQQNQATDSSEKEKTNIPKVYRKRSPLYQYVLLVLIIFAPLIYGSFELSVKLGWKFALFASGLLIIRIVYILMFKKSKKKYCNHCNKRIPDWSALSAWFSYNQIDSIKNIIIADQPNNLPQHARTEEQGQSLLVTLEYCSQCLNPILLSVKQQASSLDLNGNFFQRTIEGESCKGWIDTFKYLDHYCRPGEIQQKFNHKQLTRLLYSVWILPFFVLFLISSFKKEEWWKIILGLLVYLFFVYIFALSDEWQIPHCPKCNADHDEGMNGNDFIEISKNDRSIVQDALRSDAPKKLLSCNPPEEWEDEENISDRIFVEVIYCSRCLRYAVLRSYIELWENTAEVADETIHEDRNIPMDLANEYLEVFRKFGELHSEPLED